MKAIPVTLVGATLVLLMGACEPDAPERTGILPPESEPATAEAPGGVPRFDQAHADLDELRRVTARFHRFDAGWDAGYTTLVTHPQTGDACVASPTEGGMGRHYLNAGLLTATPRVSEPQVLMYEPTAGGGLRLVGVEYFVPYGIVADDATPPVLFGRDFLPNPVFGGWMLHVYVWKQNPEGMFATWNPRISCAHEAGHEG